MSSFNKIILIGNLTRDPEMRYTPGGSPVVSISLAINRKYKSKDGEQKEEVDFFDIEAWDKTAELCGEYLHKGSPVFIEGRLKQDRWEDQGGQKRSKVKIVASNVQFLPGKQTDKQDNQGQDWSDKPPF